jgi:hypothetical protein
MRTKQPSGKPLSFPHLKSTVAMMIAAGALLCVGVSHALARML